MSLSYAVPAGIVVFFITVALFSWEYIWSYFSIVLYLGLPVGIYLLTSIVTLLAQYSECGTVHVADVAWFSIPSAILSWFSLLLSYGSWFRIPIASVAGPFFAPPVPPANPATGCCEPPMTLEAIELQAPMVKGVAHAFYLFFSTIFGLLISIGFSTVC